MKIRVAVLDMAGTTIADEIDGTPFVLEVYAQTFRTVGIDLAFETLNEFRGLDKYQVMRTILADRKGLRGETLEMEANRLLEKFRASCMNLVDEVTATSGAADTICWLKERGLLVALASGLPQEIAEAMAHAAGLSGDGMADYVTSAERAGGGRPGPHMINDALIHFGLVDSKADRSHPFEKFDYAQVLKVGDTPADIREGQGVGAVTVAVSSGTHSTERLREECTLEVLDSIGELPQYLCHHFQNAILDGRNLT